MASPRQPRKPEDDPPMQRLLAATVADPEKAAKQAAADNKLIAAMSGHTIDVRKVEAALLDGANPDRIIREGYPALHVAVRRQNLPLLELLIRYDANLDDVDSEGNSVVLMPAT
jgi:ankyrin repeat protein